MKPFPDEIDSALTEIARNARVKVVKNTHYEALNRELVRFDNKILRRLNFTFDGDKVLVTFYADTFPFVPKLLLWLHNTIPMFPYFAKIEWTRVIELPPDKDKEFYLRSVQSLVDQLFPIKDRRY